QGIDPASPSDWWFWALLFRAITVPEEKDRRSEPVHEVSASDRTEFARREEARDRHVAEGSLHCTDVVIGLAEEALTAPVARKEERPGHRRGALRLEHRAQVLARRLGIANLELNGLPHLGHIADRDRLPDRPATLRDDSGRAVRSFEDRADRTLGEDLVVRDESRAARDDPARCHAADDGQTGRVLVQMIEKKVRRERVRIRQHDQHATGGTRRYLLEAVENAVLLFLGVGEREGSDPDSR